MKTSLQILAVLLACATASAQTFYVDGGPTEGQTMTYTINDPGHANTMVRVRIRDPIEDGIIIDRYVWVDPDGYGVGTWTVDLWGFTGDGLMLTYVDSNVGVHVVFFPIGP